MISDKDVVYISGPMTGMPFFNYFKFFGWAGMIAKEYHCEVLNPARHPDGQPYWTYMEHAEEDLKRATVVLLLDEWEKSRGVSIELHMLGAQVKKVIRETELLMDIDARMSLRDPARPLIYKAPEKDPKEMTLKEKMEILEEAFRKDVSKNG